MIKISEHPLPHFNERPVNTAIDTIVIHSLYAKDSKDQFLASSCIDLLNINSVAAHYLIARKGEAIRLVDESKRAWHAGQSRMPFQNDQRENVNDFSIGIELIGSENSSFTNEQYESLADLIHDITVRHTIKNIVGHEHIAGDRKTDPGKNFDWDKLRSILCLNHIIIGVP